MFFKGLYGNWPFSRLKLWDVWWRHRDDVMFFFSFGPWAIFLSTRIFEFRQKIFFRFFAFINFFYKKTSFDGFLRTKFNVLLQGNCLGLKDTPRGTLGRVGTISNVSKLTAILVAFSTVFPISRAFCRLNIYDCRWLTLTSHSHREEEMIPVSLRDPHQNGGKLRCDKLGPFSSILEPFLVKRRPFSVFFSERNILLLDF